MNTKAIFFDKDGTLVNNIPFCVDPQRIEFTEGTEEVLKALREEYDFHIVTNQAGVAMGYYPEKALVDVKGKLEEMFLECGTSLKGFHYCPHHPDGSLGHYTKKCDCRKPKAGMLLKASREFGIDLSSSWLVADILDDIEAGNRAGCRTILIDNGHETEWCLGEMRDPDYIVTSMRAVARLINEFIKTD